ncbi:MAG: 4Fe-4S binding protein [Chloroflexi bacterium]|nr:4Fe-4S binding protein [Chloroflexota bacterium]
MDGLKYLRDVVTLKLVVEKCIGCGRCTEVCPHAVFFLERKRARIQDRDACMECGACAINCPVEAITVNSGVGCAASILAGARRGAQLDGGCSATSCCGETNSCS